jgi:hypothetical protein
MVRTGQISTLPRPCWPTEDVLAALSDTLAHRTTAVCVIEWGDYDYQDAWLTAHGAVDLVTGQARGARRQVLDAVNHNNALVQGYDKAYASALCRNWSVAATATRSTRSARGPWRTGSPKVRSSTCAITRPGRSKAARSGCAKASVRGPAPAPVGSRRLMAATCSRGATQPRCRRERMWATAACRSPASTRIA